MAIWSDVGFCTQRTKTASLALTRPCMASALATADLMFMGPI